MMSPALLSTAKSSSTVPTTVPSGMAITVNSAVSGIAPPLVIAASRAPRRARKRLVHLVAIEIRAVTSATCGDALGEHLQNVFEFLTRQIAIRIGAPNHLEQFVLVPLFAAQHGDDLLRQDVERLVGNHDAIEIQLRGSRAPGPRIR